MADKIVIVCSVELCPQADPKKYHIVHGSGIPAEETGGMEQNCFVFKFMEISTVGLSQGWPKHEQFIFLWFEWHQEVSSASKYSHSQVPEIPPLEIGASWVKYEAII